MPGGFGRKFLAPVGEPPIAFGNQGSQEWVLGNSLPPRFPAQPLTAQGLLLKFEKVGGAPAQLRAGVERGVVGVKEHPAGSQQRSQLDVKTTNSRTVEPVQSGGGDDRVELGGGGPRRIEASGDRSGPAVAA
jgi:hypothetical protein